VRPRRRLRHSAPFGVYRRKLSAHSNPLRAGAGALGGTITLTGGPLASNNPNITITITITGNGPTNTILDGGHTGGNTSTNGTLVLKIAGASAVNISGITVQHGYAGCDGVCRGMADQARSVCSPAAVLIAVQRLDCRGEADADPAGS
jgi:hypothetical protein